MPEFWGKGLATEGANATLKLAEQHQIYDVYSFTAEANKASQRVMEKIGMTVYDHFELPNLSKYHLLKGKCAITLIFESENLYISVTNT